VLSNDEKGTIEIKSFRIPSAKYNLNYGVDLSIIDYANRDASISMIYRSNTVYDANGKSFFLPPLITDDYNTFSNFSIGLRKDLDFYVYACISEPI